MDVGKTSGNSAIGSNSMSNVFFVILKVSVVVSSFLNQTFGCSVFGCYRFVCFVLIAFGGC